MKTILIFEPLSGGHRANFIRWLTNAAPTDSDCRFVFFTAEEAGDLHLQQLSWWQRQKRLYDLFREACRKHMPDQALILELTHLELPLILFGSPVPLSAILFVQYPERFKQRNTLSSDNSGFSKYWKFLREQAQPVSKHWKTRLLLWRVPVKNIFLLNGEKSCRWLADRFGSRVRFIPLSDPAPDFSADPDFSFDADGKRVCLFFGAISRRKGAEVLLKTLRRISPETARNNVFFFCGRPEPDYVATFADSVQALRAARPDMDLRVDSRFVSDGEMTAMFEQADLVLMPYLRPEYSSGILALAAQAGTPVLGPKDGLLGRLIRENGLGIAAELTPEILEQPVILNEELRRKFVARNTIENFTKPILDTVCHES